MNSGIHLVYAPGTRRAWSEKALAFEDGSVSVPRMRPARAPKAPTMNLSELKTGIFGKEMPNAVGCDRRKPLGGGSKFPTLRSGRGDCTHTTPLRPSFVTNLTKKNDFPVTLAF